MFEYEEIVFEELESDAQIEYLDELASEKKEHDYYAKAIKEERDRLYEREVRHKNQSQDLAQKIGMFLKMRGERGFETGRNKVSTRKTKKLVIDNEEKFMLEEPEFVVEETVKKLAPKADIRKYMEENGVVYDNAHIEESTSVIVK